MENIFLCRGRGEFKNSSPLLPRKPADIVKMEWAVLKEEGGKYANTHRQERDRFRSPFPTTICS